MVTAVMADQLMAEFNIGAAALGNFSSFYYYSYVAVQIPTGILADYWGARKLLTAGTLFASLGAIVFALAPSIQIANLGRLVIGGSIGVAWVSILKLSTRWFQPNRYALVTGLALSLGIFGALSAGVPLRLLLDRFGWRPVILAVGGFTLLLSVMVWIFLRDDPVQKGYRSYAGGHGISARSVQSSIFSDLREIFRHKNTWILALVPAGMAGPMLTFSGLWGIPYFSTHYGLSPVKSASMVSTLLIALAIGSPILGALSEKTGRRKPIYFAALSLAFLGWIAVLYTQHMPLWLISCLFFIIGFASSAVVVGFAFIKESVSPAYAGTVTGVCNMGMEMGPMMLQPAIGWILDVRWNGVTQNGIRVYDLGDYQLAFALMIALSLAGAVLVIFSRETYCRQAKG